MSVLKVSQIQNLTNTATVNVDNIVDTSVLTGSILEYLTNICDGSVISSVRGSVALQNVTTQQASVTTYTDVTGSLVSYLPPAEATKVVYRFNWSMYWVHDHAISHFKFFIDSDEIIFARFNRSGRYPEDRFAFEWPISIGGTTSTNTGRQASWNTAKTLKLQWRSYGTSNARALHGTNYWDGAGSTQFCMPSITLIALR